MSEEQVNTTLIDQENQSAWKQSRIDTQASLTQAKDILALCKSKKYSLGIADSNRTIGQCFWLLGLYAESIVHLDAALPIYKDLNKKNGESEVLNLYGAIYSSFGDIPKAISYYEYSLNIRKEINDIEGIVNSMNSIGDSYIQLKEYNKALSIFKDILDINHSNSMFRGIVLYNVSEVYYHLNDLKNSVKHLNQCQALGEELDFTLMRIYCLSLFGKIAIKQNDFVSAESMLETALKLSKDTENKDRSYNILKDLSELNENTGSYKKALIYYKEYHALKESILNSDNQQKLKTLAQKLETEKLIKETDLEKQKNAELSKAYRLIEQSSKKIELQHEEISKSIRYAERIQQAILPSKELVDSLFPNNFIMYRPKDVLSGDFYWVSEVITNKKEKFCLASVADCTGHGIPGALMSLIGNNFLRLCEKEESVNSPAEALDFINKGLFKTLRQDATNATINDGMDISFIAIDYNTMKLYFSGAKSIIFVSKKGKITKYKGDSHPVGAFVSDKIMGFKNQEIDIEKGDLIYLVTDGYLDQFGGTQNRKFMVKQFMQVLSKINKDPMEDQLLYLEQTFLDWKRHYDQTDDVCVMGIRV
jgi:serine phosphatase RsbU (regulator of sigma subunit)